MPQRESLPVDRFLLFVDACRVTFSHASSIAKPTPWCKEMIRLLLATSSTN